MSWRFPTTTLGCCVWRTSAMLATVPCVSSSSRSAASSPHGFDSAGTQTTRGLLSALVKAADDAVLLSLENALSS
jgi:hypothetical protein